MPLLKKIRVLAAKIETTIGTAETLTSTEAIYGAYDVDIQPNIAFSERMGQVSFSREKSIAEGYGGTCTFKTELRGDGAGGIPAWATTLLPACGMVATAQVYAPQSAAPGSAVKTVTIAVYENGLKKALRGAVGSFKLVGPTGKKTELEWTFQGVWVPPVDATILTSPTAYGTALRFTPQTFTIGGSVPGCASTTSIDLGNTIVMRECAGDASGYASAIITDRKVTGQLDPESRLVATENVFGKWLAGTSEGLAVVLVDAIDSITITAPAIQRINVQEGDRNGIQIDTIDFQFNRSAAAGDDEITITFDAV